MLLGCITLGATGWAVKGTPPFAATSWWPFIFAGIGLLYGGLAPAVINLYESGPGAGRFLLLGILFHLLPLGAVLWYTMSAVQATPYGDLVFCCAATFVVASLLTLGGAVYRLFRRPST